jgi:phage RecT family recombinase
MSQITVTEKSVLPFIETKKQDLINLIGEDNLKRETSFAVQAVNANSFLSQATPQSVGKAIWNVAITGLSLNPIHGLSYLVPKRIGSNVEAVLMPSYKGLTKLLTDTGSVKTIRAACVYKGDEFDVILGDKYEISHKPKFVSRDVTHAYAVGLLQDGTQQFEVMSADQINDIRERSDGYKAFKDGKAKSAIWDTDYEEMAKKTVIKRLSKYLPKTDKWERMQQAIEVDNSIYPASLNQEEYIRSLVETSAYDEDRKADFIAMVDAGMSKGEAEAIIEELQRNQLNRITSGLPYSQTDIVEQQKQIS